MSRTELAAHLYHAFVTDLVYREMTPETFVADRSAEPGDFIGPIGGGIHEGNRQGVCDRPGACARGRRPSEGPAWEPHACLGE